MDTTNMLRIATDDPFEFIEGREEAVLAEYNEIAEINGWERADSATDEEVLDWVENICIFDWDDFRDNHEDDEVLVIADLGLWDGRHEGGRLDRLRRLWNSMVEDSNSLYYDNEQGVFHLCACHHDGTNWFTIYKLSPAGIDFMDNEALDYTPRQAHQYLLEHKEKYIERFEY